MEQRPYIVQPIGSTILNARFHAALPGFTGKIAGDSNRVKHKSVGRGSENGLRFIIEFDGLVFDPAAIYYAAHQAAASDVGWSRLNQATFWRLLRTKGRQADLLPGAKPVKIADYEERFAVHLESDALVSFYQPQPDLRQVLAQLAHAGACCLITLGSNLAGRRTVLEKYGLAGLFSRFDGLEADPRRRPAELRRLAEADPRTLVVAASDALIRSAGEAGLLSVGIAAGACSVARLYQAGASVVYKTLHELSASVRNGAADLIQAGLLPRSLDAPP